MHTTNHAHPLKRRGWLYIAVALAMAIGMLASFMIAGPRDAGAQENPTFIAGNPSCTSLGYANGFKIDNTPVNGLYNDGTLFVTISNVSADGKSFDWTSNIPVDAVIVKGGAGGQGGVAGSNVYFYEPDGSKGDSNLIAPNDTQISHVEFCYSPSLEVSKTADPSFTRTHEWKITKTVSPDTLDLFTGDTGEVEYTVAVEKKTTDSKWAVSGIITIYNPGPGSAIITGVSDVVSEGIAADVECDVQYPYELAALGTLECDYEADLPDADTRLNTATVSVAADSAVKGGSGTASVDFAGVVPTVVGYDEINVSDDVEGDLGAFSDTDSVSYTRTFACDDDEGEHGNTATIDETGQSDDADVTVNCYALVVTKDATTSLDRTWTWDIEKSATWEDTFGDTHVADTLTLLAGLDLNVDYLLEISATSADSEWAVSGNIWVNNPAPIDAVINDVSDVISNGADVDAAVNCEDEDGVVTFPYTLAGGDTLDCTYSAALTGDEDRLNTATATLQNYDYDEDGAGTASGTTDFSGEADVIFDADSVNEIDACVDLTDVFADSEIDVVADVVDQTICADDLVDGKYIVEYTVTLTVPDDLVCNMYDVNNTATLSIGDREVASDDWTVIVNVPCDTCTLTQGYWKTHSEFGPAKKADATWLEITGSTDATGPNAMFFLSGQTYYTVLWTAPKGNAYYNLAHQYIAAELNMLNGASVPAEVQAAFDTATDLFKVHKPEDVAKMRGNNATRAQFIQLAGILDDYNNGLIGPGHCSEQ